MAEKVAEGDTEEKKKGGKGKLFVIAGLVVVLGAGAFVGMKMLGGSDAEAEDAASETEPPAEGEVLDVATLTTNVSGADLARVGLAVVTSVGAATATVEAKYPLLKDAAVSELARTDAETLRTPEGADDLRKRLTKRAKKIYPDGEVLRVLLTEVVVQ